MPRFAILRHDAPRGLHFDLLLEAGSRLRTWALSEPPDAGVEISCRILPDHRPAYLNYEGPISDGRGTVSRWDWGTYRIFGPDVTPSASDETAFLSPDDCPNHLEQVHDVVWDSRLVLLLAGRKLVGRVVLEPSLSDSGQWRFSFTPQ